MLRIGLVSAATYQYGDAPRQPGSHHGTAFAAMCNGFDASRVDPYSWTFVRATKRLEGVRVVKVWDVDSVWAERLAAACGIPEVAPTPEACCDEVDLVLIVDDGSGAHHQYAKYPLEKGIPTFCDKPLAMTAAAAQGVVRLARSTGTPFLSSSSLRFVPDVVALRERIADLGPVYLAQAICGNELVYYGIHALSMIYAVLGGGAVSAINVGQPGLNVVRLRFGDHRDVVLMVGEKQWVRSGYQMSVFGQRGWETLTPNLKDLYWYLLRAFLDYARTGVEPYPMEQEVELIAALEAGKRSLVEGREVLLSEILG